jgi:hypothetical protein
MHRPTRIRLIALSAAGLAAAAMTPGWAASGRPAVRFSAPVKVTPANGGGYEPGIYTDRFGDLFMTAHKENAELAASPDSRSSTQTRSMSWTWYSTDHGKTWNDLPMGPADARNHEFGDEGDMATDDADNLYFIDTEVADVTFTVWHVSQGHATMTYNTPALGSAQAVDDRPWITAHLNGHVFYFGNEGDKQTYPAGSTSAGPGSGPGRYTVYGSYDGGKTWDHTGITLADSGWCRPAAAPRSTYVYAVCTDDAGANDNTSNSGDAQHLHGHLYSYVSPDDGKTWYRYFITGYNAHDGFTSWPSVQVAADGSLWALYLDGVTQHCPSGQCNPVGARFLVMHSRDHGRHWTTYDARPTGAAANWQYDYSWMSVAPDNHTLGLAVYGRPYTSNDSKPWRVYGAVFNAGARPSLVSLDQAHPVTPAGYPSAPGDFLMCVFDKFHKLHATWTRVVTDAETPVVTAFVYRDIYEANQL